MCSQPFLPVASCSAWAVCHCLWLVLWNWSPSGWFICLNFGPVPIFVLAVTFSLSLCQDYPLCWVLPCVSLGRGTLRHLLASWYHRRAKQACRCSAPSCRFYQVHKTRAWLIFCFEFGVVPVYTSKGSYLLREVNSCSMFLLSFYKSSSWHFPGSCHPRILEWFISINVFKYECTPMILEGQNERCSYTAPTTCLFIYVWNITLFSPSNRQCSWEGVDVTWLILYAELQETNKDIWGFFFFIGNDWMSRSIPSSVWGWNEWVRCGGWLSAFHSWLCRWGPFADPVLKK